MVVNQKHKLQKKITECNTTTHFKIFFQNVFVEQNTKEVDNIWYHILCVSHQNHNFKFKSWARMKSFGRRVSVQFLVLVVLNWTRVPGSRMKCHDSMFAGNQVQLPK